MSADRMASTLSRSFVVNMPTFSTAMNKDTIPHSPMASAINPFFPPITLSSLAHKRQGGRTPPELTETTNLRRAPPTQNDDMLAEVRALAGMTVLKTR
jgi:hypothetical protein